MKKWWLPGAVIGAGIAVLATAFCPICAAAVAVGLGISQYLGVDDTVVGVWMGGLIVMLSIWTANWLYRKYPAIAEWWRGIIFLGYYILILGPLWWLGKLGHPLNRLWGMDRVILGVVSGSIIVFLAMRIHQWLKLKNNGKSYFPMQRTVFILLGLLLFSILFYFLTK